MRHWIATFATTLLTSFPNVTWAHSCEAVSAGPTRTDCYLGLSQFYWA